MRGGGRVRGGNTGLRSIVGTESVIETLIGPRISRLGTAATNQLYLRAFDLQDSVQDGLPRAGSAPPGRRAAISTNSTKEANSGRNLATEPVPLAHSVTLRVLIVDDEASVRRAMPLLLARLGFPCETAHSGEEALRILERQRIDVIICALQMPGMSGMDLLAKVKQIYPHLIFLVVTGADDIRVGIQATRQAGE